jgi:hypothetical protein
LPNDTIDATPVDMYLLKTFFIVATLVSCTSRVHHGPSISASFKARPQQTDQTCALYNDVVDAAHLTGNKLLSEISSDGQFRYRFYLDGTKADSGRYNLLRHAGAVYALHQYHTMFPDRRIPVAVCHAASFLKQHTHALPSGSALAIWTPTIYRRDGREVAKLGGTGLGIIAALACAPAAGEGIFSTDELTNLGEFVEYMQKSDGSFYSRYWSDTASRDDSWTSLYYPGEAALGLLYLHDATHNMRWADAAKRALLHLADSQKENRDIPHDHWALIATAKLFSTLSSHLLSREEAQRLIAHSVLVSRAILQSQVISPGNRIDGAFDERGRTTPAATRLEGLVAAHSILPDSYTALKADIFGSIERGMRFLLTAQITEGPHAGTIPRAVEWASGEAEDAQRFDQRVREVRIDYMQHALSAMLGYVKMKQNCP